MCSEYWTRQGRSRGKLPPPLQLFQHRAGPRAPVAVASEYLSASQGERRLGGPDARCSQRVIPVTFGSRRQTPTTSVGDVPVGSAHPIVVQSMTNTDTAGATAAAAQGVALARAGFHRAGGRAVQ